MRKVAIMQPYIFPYVGYFQLLEAVDEFVFYDDVNYIKGGWINRNRILSSGKEQLFTIPCQGISSNKLINEVLILDNDKWKVKLKKSISQAYSKALFFDSFFPVFEDLIDSKIKLISEFAQKTIQVCSGYIGQEVNFKTSSIDFPKSKQANRADRLIEITKCLKAEQYINPIGGKELYEKSYFQERDVTLNFLQAQLLPYPQYGAKEFVPGLSIIDLLMNVSPEEVRDVYVKNYTLI